MHLLAHPQGGRPRRPLEPGAGARLRPVSSLQSTTSSLPAPLSLCHCLCHTVPLLRCHTVPLFLCLGRPGPPIHTLRCGAVVAGVLRMLPGTLTRGTWSGMAASKQ
eukprot:9503869-Pyramimonas_sp.AAC.1